MLALNDNQQASVMTATGKLPTEKRGLFLERVIARLSLTYRFTRSRVRRRGAPSPARPVVRRGISCVFQCAMNAE